MKIFVSHQKSDSQTAAAVAHRLRVNHQIESYLDVIDYRLTRAGEELGEYLRQQLGECSHLLAVVSTSTKGSWWVPWEIGVATEKALPLATYALRPCDLPDYLKKWPYLHAQADLDKYAHASKASSLRLNELSTLKAAGDARRDAASVFYSTLRSSLGQ